MYPTRAFRRKSAVCWGSPSSLFILSFLGACLLIKSNGEYGQLLLVGPHSHVIHGEDLFSAYLNLIKANSIEITVVACVLPGRWGGEGRWMCGRKIEPAAC